MAIETARDIPVEAVGTALALLGSAAKYLNEWTGGKKFVWQHMIAKMIIGGFSGFMMLTAAKLLFPADSPMIGIAGGVGGIMGWDALLFISDWYVKKFTR